MDAKVIIFFHEYGRRVGGVPRSSLKGMETQHADEKITQEQKPQKNSQNHNQTPPKARGRIPIEQIVFPLY